MQLWRAGLGPGVVIHSTDPASPAALGGSRLAGVLQTLDGEWNLQWSALRASQQLVSNDTMPLMNSEYYPGTLNYWGDSKFPNPFPVDRVVSGLDSLLSARLEGSSPPSFTLWLFNSQTDFGFVGGSLWFGGGMKWFVPSYDFGAPVDEAGVVRPLFYKLRDVLAKHGAVVPDKPLPLSPPVRDYGKLVMTETLSLFDALPLLAPHPVRSPTVLTMEEMGQGYGYALYSSRIPPWLQGRAVTLGGMRDLANVYVDRELQQTCARGTTAVDEVVCHPVKPDVGTCPSGFTKHVAGYWANLEPCNACPHDGQNATGSLCGAKCEKTMGCKGFEVYAGPDGSPACFIFVGELAPPFTANAGCLTCVSLIHATAEEAAAEVGDTDSRGAELDILVENFGRVTGNPVGMDRTFRGISRWVNAGSQQLADWTIAPLPLTNVSVLAQSTKWSKSKAGGSGALPPVVAFYRGSFTIAEGNLGDTFVTLHGWGKGIAFANGHALQRYWSSVGPQVSFYCPAEWLLEGANTLVLFETGRGPAADLTVTLRANHTIVG